jgi:hypothetical protein
LFPPRIFPISLVVSVAEAMAKAGQLDGVGRVDGGRFADFVLTNP